MKPAWIAWPAAARFRKFGPLRLRLVAAFDMKRIATSLVFLFALGCAQAPAPQTASDKTAAPADEESFSLAEHDADGEEALPETTSTADARNVGDYVTFAFTGSYRKQPLLMSQRVVDKDAQGIVIEYAFTEGKAHDVWRVRTNTTSGAIHAVSHQEGDAFVDASVAEFEQRLGQTVFVADENEALVRADKQNLAIAGKDLEVERSTYRVRIGNKSGTLTTWTLPGFAWGDVGGELVAAGKTVYKAELVDLGQAKGQTASLSLE